MEIDAMSAECAQADRTNQVNVYTDSLLRASLVVETAGQLWLVPRSRNGWSRRHKLTMTPAAKRERLRPARGVTADWLGVPQDDTLAVAV